MPGTSEPDPSLQVFAGPGSGARGTRGRSAPFAAQRDRGAARRAPRAVGQPLVKVAGLAWLEFEKPDLDGAERFGTDFGFTVAGRTRQTLLLRGRRAAAACLVVRRGPRPRFAGATFTAAARDDLDRLARGTGGTVTAHWGGHGILLRDPSGYPVRVVHGVPELPALPGRGPLPLNFGPGRPGSTPPSGRPSGRRRSSGWATWCWAPPGSARPWTGTWRCSG